MVNEFYWHNMHGTLQMKIKRLCLACRHCFRHDNMACTHTEPWIALTEYWVLGSLFQEWNEWQDKQIPWWPEDIAWQIVVWLIAMSWNWFINSFSLLMLMADELWFWQNEYFSRFQQPDKHVPSSNPENNVCFPSLAIIVMLKSVYENAQLNWNCAYVKNESLVSPGLQSVTYLVNYLRSTAVHATELTWFVVLLWCVPLLSPARWDLGLTNTTTAQKIWPKPVM